MNPPCEMSTEHDGELAVNFGLVNLGVSYRASDLNSEGLGFDFLLEKKDPMIIRDFAFLRSLPEHRIVAFVPAR